MSGPRSRFCQYTLSATLEVELEGLCDRFEDRLRAGEYPPVADFLAQAPVETRASLFRELLLLERDYRSRHGDTVPLQSYGERFPHYREILRELEYDREQEPTIVDGGQHAQLVENINFLQPPERPDEIGRLGEYRVLEVLGVGGMGIVFRAEDPRLQRMIALKVMKPTVAKSESAKDRFLREAKATAAIEHDNIVTIHRVGEDRGIPFIAMQFLRGESLQTRWRRKEELNQREVLRIGREVAAGLAAAHLRNLIHRDIKPDNIWLEATTGRAKILDFGLVHVAVDEAGLTESGVVLGTPRYMAPEQAQGETVDRRCDLFSLGCVLYQLVAGRPPFEGRNLTAVLVAVAHASPTPLESLCPDLHLDFSRLIMRLLSKDRELRPSSADEVARTISEIEARLDSPLTPQLPAENTTPSISLPTEQTRPAVQKWLVIGAALAALVLAGFFGIWAAGRLGPEPRGGRSKSSKEIRRGSSPVAVAGRSDREVAQWVLDHGGGVAISTQNESGIFVKQSANLPPEEFSLTWINLSGNRDLSNDDLRRLTGLQSLTELNLSQTDITDGGMAHLTDLPSLIYLNVVETDISEQGLGGLVNLPQLSQLYLSRCRIDDKAIPVLRKLNLDQLTLDGTQVTFKGLRQLVSDSTIRSLNVMLLSLTEDEVRQLSESNPNCRIESNHGVFGPESSESVP